LRQRKRFIVIVREVEMHIRRLLGIAALSAGSVLFSMPAAAAACTESFNLGSMGPPAGTGPTRSRAMARTSFPALNAFFFRGK